MQYSYLKLVLMTKLKDEGFDLFREDKLLLKVAEQDLWNYLLNLYNTENIMAYIEADFSTNEDVDEFMNFWVQSWLKKWRTRTRIIMSKEDMDRYTRLQEKAEGKPLSACISHEEYIKLKNEVVKSLISIGEVCGTQIASKHILQHVFNKSKWKRKSKGLLSTQDIIQLMIDSNKEAKRFKHFVGPYIFLKLDKLN